MRMFFRHTPFFFISPSCPISDQKIIQSHITCFATTSLISPVPKQMLSRALGSGRASNALSTAQALKSSLPSPVTRSTIASSLGISKSDIVAVDRFALYRVYALKRSISHIPSLHPLQRSTPVTTPTLTPASQITSVSKVSLSTVANETVTSPTQQQSEQKQQQEQQQQQSEQPQQQQQGQQQQGQQTTSTGEEQGEYVRFETIEEPDKVVASWLFIVAGLVFAMVVAGGLTRLTKSGLSMVHWKFTGEKRPQSEEEWEKEFDLYKQSPEYKLNNPDMTLQQFKFIYHMEYGHRSLGRVIGLVFAIPLVYFLARGRVKLSSPLAKRLGLLLGLGGTQGLIGWWMVKSGLNEQTNTSYARVSPYRLATHLVSAFIIYCLLLATGMRMWYGKHIITLIENTAKNYSTPIGGRLINDLSGKLQVATFGGKTIENIIKPTSGMVSSMAHASATLAFITALSGMFIYR